MKLQKFGIKLFFDTTNNYKSTDYIPVFHKWIQNKLINDHLLIDVADYSHILDGPGVMLIAHEGNFSLDQENNQFGLMYMRKTNLDGAFGDRFINVLSTVIDAAKHLTNNTNLNFINNSFRFIANDRLYAKNTLENQNLYKKEIQRVIKSNYPHNNIYYEDISSKGERLAFSVKFDDPINLLK